MAGQEVIHAYRHLYRGLLQAVCYAPRARRVIRTQIRRAFRQPGVDLDPDAVKRTIWFLKAAAKEKGLEHRVLKNVIRVATYREFHGRLAVRKWSTVLANQRRTQE
jgi:hypothetical protein